MTEENGLPSLFLQRMRVQLADEFINFTEAFLNPPPTSIFLNPAKPSRKMLATEPVIWAKNGFYLDNRPNFSQDPLWHAGVYYVQEASSMFTEHVFRFLRRQDTGSDGWKILDLCGAPGGKSINMISQMRSDDWLLSNEVIKSRVRILQENLIRWGQNNVFISNNGVDDFDGIKGFFDLVLADVPCSGEGLFRKDQEAQKEWSKEHVAFCASRQKKVLARLVDLLKPEGYLIFSTCTYAPAENEKNLEWLLENFDLESVKVPVQEDWGITEKHWSFAAWSYHFYPHRLKGEGLFFAILRRRYGNETRGLKISKKALKELNRVSSKTRDKLIPFLKYPEKFEFLEINGLAHALPGHMLNDFVHLKKYLYLRKAGLFLGEEKKKDFVPSPDLALSTELSFDFPALVLEKGDALSYLRKQTVSTPNHLSKGWLLFRYENHSLGWIKNLGNRINNYYPAEWRLRK